MRAMLSPLNLVLGDSVDLTFRRCENLLDAAKFTFDNMRTYYERFFVDWDVIKIAETTKPLDNFDILFEGKVVGVFRLQLKDDYMYLRDLQVHTSFQNRGIGKVVLNEVKHRARDLNLSRLKLRVFKISPAVQLYKRNGFTIQDEDDRFFNLESNVS